MDDFLLVSLVLSMTLFAERLKRRVDNKPGRCKIEKLPCRAVVMAKGRSIRSLRTQQRAQCQMPKTSCN
ncbi:hypothetical protein PLANTIT3_30050 [Plantibacter sp. T3]|nr:hypothetical protein PLANTIT3_30050 [Plantibacter sp. T3]